MLNRPVQIDLIINFAEFKLIHSKVDQIDYLNDLIENRTSLMSIYQFIGRLVL